MSNDADRFWVSKKPKDKSKDKRNFQLFSPVRSRRSNERGVAQEHIAGEAVHNIECRHELQQTRERRFALVELLVAVLAVQKARAGERLRAVGREVTLGALHVGPDEVDLVGRVPRSPGVERADLNRDRALELAPRVLLDMTFRRSQ